MRSRSPIGPHRPKLVIICANHFNFYSTNGGVGEGNQDNKEINNIVIVARPQPSSFSGMHVWSVAAAKRGSGVRVHGGNGKNS